MIERSTYLIYRKATLADINELIENRIAMRLERESDRENVDQDDFRKRTYDYFLRHMQDDSYISWIAVEEDMIVATSGMCFFYSPPTYRNKSGITAYIMNMYTKPEYRKKGIATKLLSFLIEEAKNKDCIRITLNASEMGRPVYAKYGFKDSNDDMVMYID